MNMTQIKYFLTVTKYLNFTSAANALYITQPGAQQADPDDGRGIGLHAFYKNIKNNADDAFRQNP